VNLPNTFSPDAVLLASIAVRYQLSNPRFDSLTATERQALVEHGVSQMMAAGAYVRDGALRLPEGAVL
jgi:hypothetical protein